MQRFITLDLALGGTVTVASHLIASMVATEYGNHPATTVTLAVGNGLSYLVMNSARDILDLVAEAL